MRSGAVTIGNFDGVHRGHARIVDRLKSRANDCNGPAIVFTFEPHPVRLLRPDLAPPPLTWTKRKVELLAREGVDTVIVYRTDVELLSRSPQEFFDWLIVDRLGARAMVEGPNFCFGHQRSGTTDILRSLCEQADVSLEIVEPAVSGGAIISSSRIREQIADGNVEEAGEMLTAPYRIRGMVTHGAGRGAGIGFPTANLSAIDTLLPSNGVYAGVAVTDDRQWPAAINLGPNPTFDEGAAKVEVHLIDFEGSLYGQALEVDFFARLRDIQPFNSVSELQCQLAQDVTTARNIIRRKQGS